MSLRGTPGVYLCTGLVAVRKGGYSRGWEHKRRGSCHSSQPVDGQGLGDHRGNRREEEQEWEFGLSQVS